MSAATTEEPKVRRGKSTTDPELMATITCVDAMEELTEAQRAGALLALIRRYSSPSFTVSFMQGGAAPVEVGDPRQ